MDRIVPANHSTPTRENASVHLKLIATTGGCLSQYPSGAPSEPQRGAAPDEEPLNPRKTITPPGGFQLIYPKQAGFSKIFRYANMDTGKPYAIIPDIVDRIPEFDDPRIRERKPTLMGISVSATKQNNEPWWLGHVVKKNYDTLGRLESMDILGSEWNTFDEKPNWELQNITRVPSYATRAVDDIVDIVEDQLKIYSPGEAPMISYAVRDLYYTAAHSATIHRRGTSDSDNYVGISLATKLHVVNNGVHNTYPLSDAYVVVGDIDPSLSFGSEDTFPQTQNAEFGNHSTARSTNAYATSERGSDGTAVSRPSSGLSYLSVKTNSEDAPRMKVDHRETETYKSDFDVGSIDPKRTEELHPRERQLLLTTEGPNPNLARASVKESIFHSVPGDETYSGVLFEIPSSNDGDDYRLVGGDVAVSEEISYSASMNHPRLAKLRDTIRGGLMVPMSYQNLPNSFYGPGDTIELRLANNPILLSSSLQNTNSQSSNGQEDPARTRTVLSGEKQVKFVDHYEICSLSSAEPEHGESVTLRFTKPTLSSFGYSPIREFVGIAWGNSVTTKPTQQPNLSAESVYEIEGVPIHEIMDAKMLGLRLVVTYWAKDPSTQ